MSCYKRMALMCILLMGLLSDFASARQLARTSDNDQKWSVRATFGATRLQPRADRTGWAEVRFGRKIGSRFTSIDVGIAASTSRPVFSSLTSGLEVRPWPLKRISPFVRGEFGLLAVESPELVGGVGGGIVLRLRSRLGLRVGAALNSHGIDEVFARGPVTSYAGFEYRW